VIDQKIVVIGASAGGVETLQSFVRALPPDFAAAILIVLHVPAHTPSRLDEILERAGPLSACHPKDGEPILPGRIYVAPTDQHLMVEASCIRLTRGPKENRQRPAIDVLFRSAASQFGPNAIGIVMTGMLDDGTAGLWAIKDRGGVAIVQAPEEALYRSMPDSAIKHVSVDHSLRIADMPGILDKLLRMPSVTVDRSAAPATMTLESQITVEGDALARGVMQLGKMSGNTCPACSGVLIEIKEGPILRYRCHTGHAYSLKTLVAEVDAEIDSTLYRAMRAIEERSILLDRIAQLDLARENGENTGYFERTAKAMADRAQQVKQLALDIAATTLPDD
jgi:two-component system, chemotaxis family, protein-glutamate methylesterase/glutaminase